MLPTFLHAPSQKCRLVLCIFENISAEEYLELFTNKYSHSTEKAWVIACRTQIYILWPQRLDSRSYGCDTV